MVNMSKKKLLREDGHRTTGGCFKNERGEQPKGNGSALKLIQIFRELSRR